MAAQKAVVLSLLFAILSSAQGITCPTNFQRHKNRCYFFSQSVSQGYSSWQSAREFCEGYTDSVSKYDLLVLDVCSDGYTFVRSEMDIGGYTDAYIGAYELDTSEGDWNWVNGSSLSLKDPLWGTDRPSLGTSGADCGLLTNYYESTNSFSTRRLRLMDTYCSATFEYFICEGYDIAVMEEEVENDTEEQE